MFRQVPVEHDDAWHRLGDVALHFFVVKPVARLSATADEISRGNLEVSELPVRGGDEISVLASSFNRMYVSLRKALRLLEDQ